MLKGVVCAAGCGLYFFVGCCGRRLPPPPPAG